MFKKKKNVTNKFLNEAIESEIILFYRFLKRPAMHQSKKQAEPALSSSRTDILTEAHIVANKPLNINTLAL